MTELIELTSSPPEVGGFSVGQTLYAQSGSKWIRVTIGSVHKDAVPGHPVILGLRLANDNPNTRDWIVTPDHVITPEEYEKRKKERAEGRRALQEGKKYAPIVRLYVERTTDVDEIASLLNLPSIAVRSMLSAARRRGLLPEVESSSSSESSESSVEPTREFDAS